MITYSDIYSAHWCASGHRFASGCMVRRRDFKIPPPNPPYQPLGWSYRYIYIYIKFGYIIGSSYIRLLCFLRLMCTASRTKQNTCWYLHTYHVLVSAGLAEPFLFFCANRPKPRDTTGQVKENYAAREPLSDLAVPLSKALALWFAGIPKTRTDCIHQPQTVICRRDLLNIRAMIRIIGVAAPRSKYGIHFGCLALKIMDKLS